MLVAMPGRARATVLQVTAPCKMMNLTPNTMRFLALLALGGMFRSMSPIRAHLPQVTVYLPSLAPPHLPLRLIPQTHKPNHGATAQIKALPYRGLP